jgi:hypothetical protein
MWFFIVLFLIGLGNFAQATCPDTADDKED